MENFFLLAVIVAIVAIVAFGFAFATNKAEHHPEKRTQKKETKSKPTKKEQREKKQAKEKNAAAILSKKEVSQKKGKNTQEEDDSSMIEFLRGTSEFNAQQAKEAKANKAKTDSKKKTGNSEPKVQSQAQPIQSEDSSDYTTINRKKENAKKAKNEAPTDVNTPNVNVEAGEGKKKKKAFLKTEVPAKGEKRPKGDKSPRRRGPIAEIDGVVSDENGERKPRRKENSDGEQFTGEDTFGDSPANGPRNSNRPPREPKKPREVQPIPKPLSGTFEIPSLDEMLNAISSQTETKRSGDAAIKETSA